jgi:hypothetical protein
VYAMKETDMSRMGAKERADAVNEIRVLGSMKHPNVVRHHETFVSGAGVRGGGRAGHRVPAPPHGAQRLLQLLGGLRRPHLAAPHIDVPSSPCCWPQTCRRQAVHRDGVCARGRPRQLPQGGGRHASAAARGHRVAGVPAAVPGHAGACA